MAVREKIRKEHKQELRTIPLLCCCCSSLMLLLFSCLIYWSPLRQSYVLSHDVAADPSLNNANNPQAKSEMRNSVWESSEPAAAMMKRTMRLPEGEKYMWYSPHGGFSNQARELMNALKIAFLLNRTLIVPPVLDHFELEHGTCFEPLHDQRELRKLAWAAITERFTPSSPRAHVSIADIIDLSSIKSTVKTIDLRVFLALWCNIDISPACLGPVCYSLAVDLTARLLGTISSCAAQFFSTATGNKRPSLVHEVQDDCRTTIWTHGESMAEKLFLEHLLREQLHNDTTLPSTVDTSSLHIRRKDVFETFGPASSAGESFLLTFGTLFGRFYEDKTLMVDIKGSSLEQSTASILKAIEHQPFSVDIADAGRYFVEKKIKRPFFCTHVRLQDGDFISKQEINILKPLRQRLEELKVMSSSNDTTRQPINVFVMTDLPREKWLGTYLYDLIEDPKYKIHTMDGEEDLLYDVIQKIEIHEYGLHHGFLPQIPDQRQIEYSPQDVISRRWLNDGKRHNLHASSVRLFVEEIVCSCANLGFQGTLFSTITRNILKMREFQMCPV